MMHWKKGAAGIAAAVMILGLGQTVYGIGNEIGFGKIRDMQEETEESTEYMILEEEKKDLEEAEEDVVEDQVTIPDIKKIARENMPAIVAITNVSVAKVNYFGREYKYDSESTGSGIIIDEKDGELLIATNHHVVEGAEELTVCFSVETEDEDDKLVSAQLKGSDSALDLAVVAVDLQDIPDEVLSQITVAEIGDSDQVEVGEWVIAIGNALGYGQSVTFGIVSALDREVTLSTENGIISNPMLQIDAAINFGNSGGALLDSSGRLIGINSAKAAETGVEGMGYAIPINTAIPVIEELMTQTTRRKVDEKKAGALGIIPVDVSEEARKIYNIPSGAYVYELTENSAAQSAGIRQGDIIVKLDQTVISSKNELLERMKYYEAGETVDVTVKRTGAGGYEDKVISVVLGRKSDLEGYESQDSQKNDQKSEDDDQDDSYGYGEKDDEEKSYSPYYNGRDYDPFDLFEYFGF